MLGPYDHVLAAILVLGLPPRAWFAFRALRNADDTRRPGLRLRLYAIAMITQWSLVAVVAIRWLWTGRGWAEIGLIPAPTPGALGVLFGVVVIVAVDLIHLRPRLDPALLERGPGRLGHVAELAP